MTKDTPHVLVVDDETNVRRVLGTQLEQAGFVTTRAASGEQALDLVRAQDPDLVLTDLRMGGMDGLDLLARLSEEFPEIPVILLTAHGNVETAVEAMKRGAYDFLTKPFDKQHVVDVVSKALDQAGRRRLEHRSTGSTDPIELIGDAPVMLELKRIIEKVAPTPATVLIQGETGTGKELVAEALHRLSPRSSEPLIKINCGAIPESLVESELFGHERGAFTGAERAKPGRFELADGGTLFLDEIGELSPETQVKLLRIIEDRRIERVGGTEPRPIDVRLVTATHRDLAREVRSGGFREDLYFRLKVIVIDVPPLRERPEDVERLVEFFLDRHATRLQRPRPRVTREALTALAAEPWPGNVRELENAVERAMLLANGPTLTADDFALTPDEELPEGNPTSLKEVSKRVAAATERRLIRAALETYSGNVTRAARRLGLSRRGLQLKMKELGLRQNRD